MEYEVNFSKRRTVTLKVRDGKLFVLAPTGTPSEYIENIIFRHRRWISDRMATQERKAEMESTLTDEDIARLKREARLYFTEKTEYFAAVMGLDYKKVRISSAKGRFGSCSSSGNISYTYRLMLYPEAAREYVVVHELAHLREMNHSSRFYAIVAGVLPDYKSRKRLLK